jgi:hypothetical protein
MMHHYWVTVLPLSIKAKTEDEAREIANQFYLNASGMEIDEIERDDMDMDDED